MIYELNRYIFTVVVFGGFCIGVFFVLVDFLGKWNALKKIFKLVKIFVV